MLLYASNKRLEGWVSLDVGGPVELLKWRSASTLEAAPMWVSPTHNDAHLWLPQFFLTQQYRLFSNYSAFLQIGMC